MSDTNHYGTAHSGRVQFARQAAVASLVAPGIALLILVLARVVLGPHPGAAVLLVGFVVVFCAFLGVVLGIASLVGLRRKYHDSHRILAALGLGLSLLFLALLAIAAVLAHSDPSLLK